MIHTVYGVPSEGDDRWWFYIDVETDELVANMVNHLDHHSFIDNLAFDTTTILTLNAHRKSYFTDSLRNVRYLRAEYFYTDFELVLEGSN